jgi:hypothetical protein
MGLRDCFRMFGPTSAASFPRVAALPNALSTGGDYIGHVHPLQRPTSVEFRCFIAASRQIDGPIIARTLHEAGVAAVFAEDFMPAEATALTVVRQALEASDLMLGVLSEDADNTTVAFELGMAAAMRKPAIALIPRGMSVPLQFEAHVVVRGDTADLPALRFAVEQLVGNLPHGVLQEERRPTTESAGATLGAAAQELVRRLDAWGPTIRHDDLMQLLTEAFRALGITAVEGSGDARFDLGVWDSELAGLVGNPFVIEVKQGLARRDQVTQALAQVERYLSATGGRWALLVYGAGDEALIAEAASGSRVLTSSARELILGLRDMTFAEFVRRIRAARVHGVEPTK